MHRDAACKLTGERGSSRAARSTSDEFSDFCASSCGRNGAGFVFLVPIRTGGFFKFKRFHFNVTQLWYGVMQICLSNNSKLNFCLTMELISDGIDLRIESFDNNYGDGQWNLMKLVNNSAENQGIWADLSASISWLRRQFKWLFHRLCIRTRLEITLRLKAGFDIFLKRKFKCTKVKCGYLSH